MPRVHGILLSENGSQLWLAKYDCIIECEDGMLSRLSGVCSISLSIIVYLLRQRIQPLLLQRVASAGIVGWIVAGRSYRDSGHELPTNSGVQCSPRILRWPTRIAWQAKALLSLCLGSSEENCPNKLRNNIELHLAWPKTLLLRRLYPRPTPCFIYTQYFYPSLFFSHSAAPLPQSRTWTL